MGLLLQQKLNVAGSTSTTNKKKDLTFFLSVESQQQEQKSNCIKYLTQNHSLKYLLKEPVVWSGKLKRRTINIKKNDKTQLKHLENHKSMLLYMNKIVRHSKRMLDKRRILIKEKNWNLKEKQQKLLEENTHLQKYFEESENQLKSSIEEFHEKYKVETETYELESEILRKQINSLIDEKSLLAKEIDHLRSLNDEVLENQNIIL